MNTEPINILLIGGGGREHALTWKMAQSPLSNKLFVAPGNAGTAALAQNVDLDYTNFDHFKAFLLQEDIAMIVVGPEIPLVAGLYDQCKADPATRHIAFIGPSKEAAQLEGSKAYAKDFMIENNIPTAAFQKFDATQYDAACDFLETLSPPYVLKADGLAAGKGVLLLDDLAEAKAALKTMLDGQFGAASATVVIEEFLTGIEFSVFVLTDGKDYKVLPIAKDYKRIGVGDTGPNTGGMGAVSPVPFVSTALMEKVETEIIKPTIQGIQNRGLKYQGFVFIGLISDGQEAKVIEYNCRLGDPETEVVLPRLKNDLVALFDAIEKGNLSSMTIEKDPRTVTTVMLVSGGYPGSYVKGKKIEGISEVEEGIVFHAGTKITEDQLVTNGGRVLAISAYGDTIPAAVSQSLAAAEKINFEDKFFRNDIGQDLI